MKQSRRYKKIEPAWAGANSHWRLVAIAAVILFVTSAVYWQVYKHQFINYDDPKYVTENRYVQSGLSWENVKWAFMTKHASNWHPLT